MVDIVANPEWKSVRILERDEVALGGYGGNMNAQATALVARTEFLMQEKADTSDIIQGQYSFSTLAEFDSKKATIPANSVVIIDEAGVNQGANTWNGTTLTKSVYDPLTQAKTWATAEFANDILRPSRIKNNGLRGERINRAIKSISLRGDYNGKLITLAALSYSSGIFTIILARPDSPTESMTPSGNTKFVSRFQGAVTFSGVQTLTLVPHGNTAAEIGGTITINFDELLSTDLLVANYTASDRLVDSRTIIDLNGQYATIKSIKDEVSLNAGNIASTASRIDDLQLVNGTDAKNKMLNDTIEELVFFKPLPIGKYLNLASLSYSGTRAVLHIYAADDKTSKGTLWAEGQGLIENNKALIFFDQGYANVNLNNYVPTNTGAAVLGDNATFNTRGITNANITTTLLNNKVFQRYEDQFVKTSIFDLPTDIWQRSLKLYVKGDIADTDYYLPNVLNWSFTAESKYRLTYQIKKMTATDQVVTGGVAVYSGNIEFDSLAEIKGKILLDAVRINNHPNAAIIEINLDNLPYRTDNNTAFSPMFFNKSGFTYATHGFDIQKLRFDSTEKFKSAGGGLTTYASLKDALDVKEIGIFAVGGNTFKARNANPLTKEDILCVNNPPKLMSRMPKTKNYDFFYKNVKVRLEQIDSDDNFYFLNAGVIVKSPQPMKQTWTSVASAASADLVVFDVVANAYFSISDHAELFTAAQLAVPTISFMRLTYDEELLIIATDTVRVIMFTENNQTSLRTFNFNGSIGTKYDFGAGVNIIKDWCMSHHKNVMFFSDYDSGITVGGANVRGTTGGQKAYVSLDNGYTFTECFDFTGNDWSKVINASNITNFGATQAHIHAVTYDPKQNIVWIVTGDGAVSRDNTSFFYSRDLGQTWTHLRSSIVDTGQKSQMIMALPFDGCVAFGSDDNSINGVGVITYNGNNMVHEVASQVISKNALLAFARSTWHSQKHGVKYISFGQDSQKTTDPDAKSFVVASANGYHWEEIWADNNAAIYGNVYCYDDIDGNVYISLDGTGVYKDRVVLCDVGYM